MQLELVMHGHGGRREGAGRPRRSRRMGHQARERIGAGVPVLVTLRVARDVPTLRDGQCFRAIERAADDASREEARIVHYSVQDDHLHLVSEARDLRALSLLMRRFQIRVARSINAIAGRAGKVFPDRYHHQPLSSPRQVRHTLAYLFNNRRHHLHDRSDLQPASDWLDPYSTAILFDGWRDDILFASSWADPTRAWPATTWLLRVGWRRHGLLAFDEIPAVGRRRKAR